MASDDKASARDRVRVWDPFVRLFHWTVAAAFFVAYFTDDDVLTLHVWAGYTAGALVAMRLIWGFAGPRHARFSDFLYGPGAVLRYLADLMTFRARRYLGHSPAGGAMALALMLGLAAAVWTGLELYAAEENAGPLAELRGGSGLQAPPAAGRLVLVSEDDDGNDKENGEERNGEGGEVWEELHEALAELLFVLVVLHVVGVLWSSAAHRENLPRAMISGYKRPE